MNISLAEIGKFLGAELRNFAPCDDIVLRNVLTDSRADLHGALFVALKGENFDAHNFLDKAVEAGAVALCINKNVPTRSESLLFGRHENICKN